MRPTPWFVGACALVSIAGAVSGAAINATPIQQAGIGSEEIRRPAVAFDAVDTGHRTESLPDHYAMITPQGRVEVAELSTRGLYAQDRYGYREAAYEAPAYSADEPAYESDPEPVAEVGASAVETAPVHVAVTAQPALALTQPATLTETADGQPRIIDVAATLAAR